MMDIPFMWKYLKAWRLYRDFSQEQVANALKKRHTTISRWERGEMKLKTEDLQRLAEFYGASVPQLLGPPEVEKLTARMERAQEILALLDEDDLERWLGIGESLARK